VSRSLNTEQFQESCAEYTAQIRKCPRKGKLVPTLKTHISDGRFFFDDDCKNTAGSVEVMLRQKSQLFSDDWLKCHNCQAWYSWSCYGGNGKKKHPLQILPVS
jgi:hypothetical protein